MRVNSELLTGILAAILTSILLLVFLVSQNNARPVLAASLTVDTTVMEDSHPAVGAGCSLYEAVIAANNDTAYGGCAAGSGADVITLPSGTFNVTFALPVLLNSDVELVGQPDNSSQIVTVSDYGIRIDGSNIALRNLHFDAGFDYGIYTVNGPHQNITIENVSVTNGSIGGIFLNAIEGLTLDDITLTGSESSLYVESSSDTTITNVDATQAYVGLRDVEDAELDNLNAANGVYGVSVNGTAQNIDISNISISGASLAGINFAMSGSSGETRVTNATLVDGGGYGIRHEVDDGNTHSLIVNDSYIARNAEGGVYNNECAFSGPISTTLYLTNTMIADNGSGSLNGGGVNNQCGHVVLERVTISGNQTNGDGGGIHNLEDSQLTLINTTIYDNQAGGNGGGIAIIGTTTTPAVHNYLNVTIAGNEGAGIYIGAGNNHAPILNNVLVADNSGQQCSGLALATGSSNNLSSDNSCSGFELTELEANLASSLADNGGSALIGAAGGEGNIMTLALQDSSPAINAGTNSPCPSTDARNLTRPQGSVCDIGAYESTVDTPLPDTGAGSHWPTTLSYIGIASASVFLFKDVLTRWRMKTARVPRGSR